MSLEILANQNKRYRSYYEYVPYFKDGNYSNSEIAKVFGVHRSVVCKMRTKYLQDLKDNKIVDCDPHEVMKLAMLTDLRRKTKQDSALIKLTELIEDYLHALKSLKHELFKEYELRIAMIQQLIDKYSDELDNSDNKEALEKTIDFKTKELDEVKKQYFEAKLKFYNKYVKQANRLLSSTAGQRMPNK